MAAAAPTTHASRPARSDLLLAVPACLFAVATIAVIESTTPWGTTYSGSSIGALAGDLAAGLGLLLAAALSIGEPTSRRVGWLLALAAIAWFAPDWVGWQRGDSVVRSIAALVQPLFAPLLAWAVALPLLDRSARAGLRRTLRLCVGGALLLSVALILVDDPRQDATCWNNCTDNAFLVASEPGLAASLGAVTSLAAILSGVLLAFVAVLRARLASTAGRRLLWPIAAPAVAVGAVVALRGVVLLPRPMQDPRIPGHAALPRPRVGNCHPRRGLRVARAPRGPCRAAGGRRGAAAAPPPEHRTAWPPPSDAPPATLRSPCCTGWMARAAGWTAPAPSWRNP